MPVKKTKTSTAVARDAAEKSLDERDAAMPVPEKAATEAPAEGEAPSQEVRNEVVDNRSLEEILSSIPPPPPPAMTNEAGAPRLMITHIVNQNFKSYAGERILGPFHKRFSCIIGPNGSGKSNVIDSMLFVFGYRAQKIRSKKLSVLIHNSDEHKDVQSCTVEVHFQKIIDKEGDDFDVIPNSQFYVSRTAYKDNSSVYHISGKKKSFKDVGILLRSHGIDLDHNRFLILQGEVEQIAMMKPKGQTEHDEGMLEYLEDIIGSERLKEPIQILCRRVELLNEQRGEKLNRVKMVEKEKDALEGEKNKAIEFLTVENETFKKKNQICQFYIHDLQKRMHDMEAQKAKIQEDTKEINEKSSMLSNDMKVKNTALKDVEKQLNKITKFIEENREKFTQLDLQDVDVREKLKHSKSKVKKLQKQLQKDQEKVEEIKSVPASSQKIISDATNKKEILEKQKDKEEEKLREVMDSLKKETQGLQAEKEEKERELMEFNKTVNEARSKMDVAQSELDIYLSRYNNALSQLNKAKEALTTASATLKERKSAIQELETKLPKAEEELKKIQKDNTPVEDTPHQEYRAHRDSVIYTLLRDIFFRVYHTLTRGRNTRPHIRRAGSQSQTPQERSAEDAVINFSSHVLSASEHKLLNRGLSFMPSTTVSEYEQRLDVHRLNRTLKLREFFQNVNTNCPKSPVELNCKIQSSFEPTNCSPSTKTFIRLVTQDLDNERTHTQWKNNLTHEERKAITTLQVDDSIIVRPADKGGTIVLLNDSDYREDIMEQLSDLSTYTPLTSDPTFEYKRQLDALIKMGFEQGFITDHIKKICTILHPRIPIMYTIPKIHKRLEKPPGRPIVSAVQSLLQPVAQYIYFLLQPVVRDMQSFILDTNDLIRQLGSVSVQQGDILVTLDVNSLYTIIPHQVGLLAIREHLTNNPHYEGPPVDFVLSLIEFCLHKNYFRFEGTMTGGGGKVMKGRMGSSVMMEISEDQLQKMESKLKTDSDKATAIQDRKVQLEEEVSKLRLTTREMRNTFEKYTASLQSLSEQEIHLKAQVKELEANVAATTPDRNQQKQMEKTLETFKKEYEKIAEKSGKVEAEVKRLHNLIVDINNHKLKSQQDKLDKINKEIDECASAITKAQVSIKTADREKNKQKNVGTSAVKCCLNRGSLPEIQEQHRGLLQEIKSIQDKEHALQKDALNIRLKIEQIDSHISEHQSKIKYWQKEISKITLHKIEDMPEEALPVLTQEELESIKDPDIINNQIALLEARSLEMKPNLGAIAEYKKKEELYLQRVAELDEITNERDNFRRAYEDLRKQRLNEFMAGFNVITNKLKENYQMLTLGGDAELELVDSLDPFSEGIMFSVRPPKKSWKKIFNLSGGEKTLSSLALVFALHHYKPTPLYFMDEIDAALDFKNVSIVAFYIYEQTKNAQFIIISLRNNMFEIADRLIGIYKTHNTTKSVATNPKIIASKGLAELNSVGFS
ncbi:structural maintenance of chromosomes protein 4 [Bombina bombina]|uniref:structural maintenance of chromosomes protein 4 n=1 Tax=Bombina bombina TaxID=8345 RepID=UPI00235A967E|nr:structural maintenance of chromosomes protein 4 [Bombina bombina]